MKYFYEEVDATYGNAVLDYIAGMTDDYAIECISEIMIPKEFEHQFDALLYKGE
jgi:dGTPase